MQRVYHKICKLCGKSFESTSNRRQVCYDKHFKSCPVCGKLFEVSAKSTKMYCSLKCAHASPRYACQCRICGKIFMSGTSSATVCNGPHYATCVVCGKQFEVSKEDIIHGIRSTCSNECLRKLHTIRNLEIESDQCRKASKHDQMKTTMLSKYGVENAMQCDIIKDKAKSTNLSRYGVSSFTQTPQFIDKCIQTNRDKYNEDWYMQTDEYKERCKSTCMSKYGVANPSMAEACIVDKVSDPTKVSLLMEFRDNPKLFISSHFDSKPTLRELSDICGIRDSSVGWILANRGLIDLVKQCYSTMEDEVYNFISSIAPHIIIYRNTRKIIPPHELDLYLPEFKLGIECNPTATHNSSVAIFAEHGCKPTSPSYHKLKTDKCEASGIFLFHIYGYEWTHKKEIIKSMLCNLIGVNCNKVYGRNTYIQELPSLECSQFLNANHRQGNASASIRIGLFENTTNILVAVMTFSRGRHTIGNLVDTQFELVRFCNRINTNVIGGASKLLKYFITKYHPTSIVSFSDRSHTKGNLYHILGFKCIHCSDPSYVWVDQKTDKAYSRINAQKRNIQKFLKDPTIDLSQSEFTIMESHDYVRVYDSGVLRWELTVKEENDGATSEIN